jgi:hypothetical protein
MKLSVEAKVAAAVAAGFIALTAAAIGERGSEIQSGGPNNYNPSNAATLKTQISDEADNNSLPGGIDAEHDSG